MGKWGVFVQQGDLQLYAYDGNVVLMTLIDTVDNLALLRQIAREHNAHEELVSALRSARIYVRNEADMMDCIPGEENYQRVLLGEIDAVLAQAEGRE